MRYTKEDIEHLEHAVFSIKDLELLRRGYVNAPDGSSRKRVFAQRIQQIIIQQHVKNVLQAAT